MDGFLRAIGLLTIFDLPAGRRAKTHDMSGVARFFPLVGLCMGVALFAIGRTGVAFWSRHTVSILVVLSWFIITGREHMSGLAAAFEALLGASDRETRLAVLKGPKPGPLGLLGPVGLFLLKYSLFGEIEIPHIFCVLLCTPMLSRAILVLNLFVHVPAKQEGTGFRVHRSIFSLDLIISLAGSGLLAFLLAGPWGLVSAAAAALASLSLGFLIAKLAGGFTDETTSLTMEICELCLLAFFAAGQTLLFYPLVKLAA